MVGGAHTVVELSPERIPPKSIDLLLMLLDGLPNLLSQLVYAIVLVQLSYAIGVSYPLSIHVDTYGTCKRSGKTDTDLVEIVKKNFDLRPGGIIRDLNLRRPCLKKTAAYGHFGRNDPDFTWETPKELTM